MKTYFSAFMAFCLSAVASLADGPEVGLYFVTNGPLRLEKVELATQPVFTDADIVAYHWTNHTFQLTEEAAKRVPSTQGVGTGGKWFVVMANGQRCYLGAFWTPVSSLGCSHPVILVPIGEKITTFKIEAGYPTGRIPEGFPDQRNSEALKEALLNTRKLKDRQ